MATFAPSPTMPALNLTTTEAESALETDLALPGIKRGIAIGVACSVSVVVIAILAFFAIRRRNRVLARRAQLHTAKTEATDTEAGSQEKAWWAVAPPPTPPLPPPSPVEADAQIIYELDAGQMPELHGDTAAQEVDGNDNYRDTSNTAADLDAQKLEQRKTWGIAPEPKPPSPTIEPAYSRLPLVMISPPEASPGDVSPLLRSSWDLSSQNASPISPPANAHFPSGHRGNTDT